MLVMMSFYCFILCFQSDCNGIVVSMVGPIVGTLEETKADGSHPGIVG